MDKLRVGVIGCGQIAQIMHLPYLMELPQYELGAICDISAKVVNTVGEWYGVSDRYVDYKQLLALRKSTPRLRMPWVRATPICPACTICC